MTRSPDYVLSDGSPRFGIRDDSPADQPETAAEPVICATAIQIVAEAATLNHYQLSAAMNLRLISPWADKDDDCVVALRAAHPEHTRKAEHLVTERLGRPVKWLYRISHARIISLKPLRQRRSETGLSARVGLQRALVLLALVMSLLVLANSEAPTAVLVALGVVFIYAARIIRAKLRNQLRIPDFQRLRLAWVAELRQDIADAVLLALLAADGSPVDAKTVAAAGRGWKNIQFAASKIDELARGPRP